MRTWLVLLALALTAAPVRAAVIANGSAPPDPANVIDDARYGVGATLYVRNVGCPPGGAESDPCPAPGAPTSIEYLAPAASALWALHVRDASHALVSGGAVRTSITTADTSTLTMQDGLLGLASQGACFCASGSSSLELLGGEVAATPSVGGSATLTVDGGLISGVFSSGSVSGSGSLVLLSGEIGISIGVADTGSFTMSGGEMATLVLEDSGSAAISGGDISRLTNVSGSATISGGSLGLYETTGLAASELLLSGGSHSTAFLLAGGVLYFSGGTLSSGGISVDGAGAAAYLSGSAVASEVRIRSGLVHMVGGEIPGDVHLRDGGSFVLRGGSIGGRLLGGGVGGEMRIVGSDFQVDGSPVPHGAIAQQTGTLTGTLASGDPIDAAFLHAGVVDPLCFNGVCSGTIVLADAAPGVPALGPWLQGLLGACLLAAGVGRLALRHSRSSALGRCYPASP